LALYWGREGEERADKLPYIGGGGEKGVFPIISCRAVRSGAICPSTLEGGRRGSTERRFLINLTKRRSLSNIHRGHCCQRREMGSEKVRLPNGLLGRGGGLNGIVV